MSDNDNVAARTPELPVSLQQVAGRLLEEARAGSSGHAALTLTPAKGGPLKQTLVALCDGGHLDPAHWNGPASLQVILGDAMVSGTDAEMPAGTWTMIPEGGEVSAPGDLVALVTVSLPQS